MKTIAVFSIFVLAAVLAHHEKKASNENINHEERIIGGLEAQDGAFKYTVSVQKLFLFLYHHICGGALIKENFVLTAAQCVGDGRLRVRAGANNLLSWGAIYSDVETKFIHPNYSVGNDYSKNDIAVLKLKTPLTSSQTIHPIALPQQNTNAKGFAVLSGWGATNSLITIKSLVLRYANISIVSLDECKTALQKAGGNPALLGDSHICTLSEAKFTCAYDQGSPLAQNDTVMGIVSWIVNPCDKQDAPSIYTNVAKYVSWINQQLGN